jgi:hypothetical protein
MIITIEQLRDLATEAGHYIDSEVHDFISYVEGSVCGQCSIDAPELAAVVDQSPEALAPDVVEPTAAEEVKPATV